MSINQQYAYTPHYWRLHDLRHIRVLLLLLLLQMIGARITKLLSTCDCERYHASDFQIYTAVCPIESLLPDDILRTKVSFRF
jgi:hypothetical protein